MRQAKLLWKVDGKVVFRASALCAKGTAAANSFEECQRPTISLVSVSDRVQLGDRNTVHEGFNVND